MIHKTQRPDVCDHVLCWRLDCRCGKHELEPCLPGQQCQAFLSNRVHGAVWLKLIAQQAYSEDIYLFVSC